MRPIDGKAKSISELLKDKHYGIDYYQREYKWERKQVEDLVGDLTSAFRDAYDESHLLPEVANYPGYFLGSVIMSSTDKGLYIIDGQQRLTTISLLLIHLYHLALGREDVDPFIDLVFSSKFGQKSFNLDVPDRTACMSALLAGDDFTPEWADESISNLLARYDDIRHLFPEDLTDRELPFIVQWLIHKVQMVEITAYSDDDAYEIFETMNDRGLKLAPTDMLKSYLLVNMAPAERARLNDAWRRQLAGMAEPGREYDSEFIKTWLRSQYAQTIRERKRGAAPGDWDRIGTEFHRWVREHAADPEVGLTSPAAFARFVERDFAFFGTQYTRLRDAACATDLATPMRFVRYNNDRGFTLQYQLLLAPISADDSDDDTTKKYELVSRFVDILLARRVWNGKTIAYSTMQYAMFLVMRDIRRTSVADLADKLYRALTEGESAELTFKTDFRLNQQNRYQLHYTLARISDFVASGAPGDPQITPNGRIPAQPGYLELAGFTAGPYEIEHIWADKAEQHPEFAHPYDFAQHRNLVGDLLLLPKGFNASFGALPYADKVGKYVGKNLLAESLSEAPYTNNPYFRRFLDTTGLPFKPYQQFTRDSIIERTELYRQIAAILWNPQDILDVAIA